MKINTEEVSSISSSINASINSIKTQIGKLYDLIPEISEAWEGEREKKFVDIFEKIFLTKLNELESDLEKYEFFLKNVPKSYLMLDEEYGNKDIDV